MVVEEHESVLMAVLKQSQPTDTPRDPNVAKAVLRHCTRLSSLVRKLSPGLAASASGDATAGATHRSRL